jgi:peptide/nickel transport system substrate-binding protein
MENVVDIPLMYRPYEFYEFNWSNWVNFPTADDPSAPPMFSGAGVEVLYQLSPYPRLFLPYLIR